MCIWKESSFHFCAASIPKLSDVLSLSWGKWRRQWGWRRGGFNSCKLATKPGFELRSGRFRLWVVGQFEYLEWRTAEQQQPQPPVLIQLTSFCGNKPVLSFYRPTCAVSDNLARCGALENLVNNMVDVSWDDKAVNRHSAIHFLDDDYDEDDEKVPWIFIKLHVEETSIKLLSAVWSSHGITTVANLFIPHTGDSPSKGHSSPRRAENDEESRREPPQRPERCQKPGLQQKRGQ